MVSSFDHSTGAKPPDSACFQMSDEEFSTVLRGWKHPPLLGEDLVSRSGVNPFTKKPFTIVSRRPARQPEPSDPDAERHPKIWHLPWIEVREVYDFHFDLLGMILLGWSKEYATGEVSSAHVRGPENANYWFVLFPERVVAAIAALSDDRVFAVALRWSTSDEANPIADADALLRRLVAFTRSALASGRRVYFWGDR
jgi:hypothetical protein